MRMSRVWTALLGVERTVIESVEIERATGTGGVGGGESVPVSYTHLTLPTNREV